MKKSRLAAAGFALALAAGSVAIAGPAIAADIYVPDNSQGTEGDSYPNGWFTGNPQPETAPVDDATGINLTGRTQFLYGGIIPITAGAEFAELVAGSDVDADGTLTFQYPIFFNSTGEGDLGFTTLRPVPTGAPTAGGMWFSSQNVAIGDVVILFQGEHTWAEIVEAFDDAIAQDGVPEVLAVGVFVDPGDTALVRSVTFGGNTYHFAAQAVAPVPAPIQRPADFTG